jgi:hypothetical protein
VEIMNRNERKRTGRECVNSCEQKGEIMVVIIENIRRDSKRSSGKNSTKNSRQISATAEVKASSKKQLVTMKLLNSYSDVC